MKTKSPAWKRLVLAAWLGLWPLLGVALWYPIRFASLRAGIVATIALLLGGALLLFWSVRPLRWAGLALGAALLAIAIVPERAVDAGALRREYVGAMQSYDGVPYVWGGETRRGIDCSGLMRCGLIDASLRRGLVTLNPALARAGLSLWWNDLSARAMKDEHGSQTRVLFTAPSINLVDLNRLQPGDMAVTSNDVHVLAYVGRSTWIEADPSALAGDKVVQVKAPTPNAWFNTPVHIVRWRRLDS